MLVLVCYDVSTETKAGRKRLRRVAKLCESTGQRVQKSVFECQLDVARFEALERELLAEIDIEKDCLRLYRIPETRGFEVLEHGVFSRPCKTPPARMNASFFGKFGAPNPPRIVILRVTF